MVTLFDSQRPLRLAYIADVPIEASYHGSALIYRLLEDFPPESLLVVECGVESQRQRRLPGVEYCHESQILQRLLNTRFSKFFGCLQLMLSSRLSAQSLKAVKKFSPTAVLSVGHGLSWFKAFAFAKAYQLPLNLILHDDLPGTINLPGFVKPLIECRFRVAYRFSRANFCVSPYMIDDYQRRYCAGGLLLYPGRSKHTSSLKFEQRSVGSNGLRLGFAGTINSRGAIDALQTVARALGEAGKLCVFGPQDPKAARESGLTASNVEFCGLIPSERIVETLAKTMTALLLPISFDPNDRANMSIHFPSKLTDYTATSLPILVYGPDYCSAVKWSRSNDGVALIATTENELQSAICRLQDAAECSRIGKLGAEIGGHFFDHAVVKTAFFQGLELSLSSR